MNKTIKLIGLVALIQFANIGCATNQRLESNTPSKICERVEKNESIREIGMYYSCGLDDFDYILSHYETKERKLSLEEVTDLVRKGEEYISFTTRAERAKYLLEESLRVMNENNNEVSTLKKREAILCISKKFKIPVYKLNEEEQEKLFYFDGINYFTLKLN